MHSSSRAAGSHCKDGRRWTVRTLGRHRRDILSSRFYKRFEIRTFRDTCKSQFRCHLAHHCKAFWQEPRSTHLQTCFPKLSKTLYKAFCRCFKILRFRHTCDKTLQPHLKHVSKALLQEQRSTHLHEWFPTRRAHLCKALSDTGRADGFVKYSFGRGGLVLGRGPCMWTLSMRGNDRNNTPGQDRTGDLQRVRLTS